MNSQLRPVTLRTLHAFRARRRLLLGVRAVLCLLAVALSAWLVIALLDRLRWVPEVLRPWLTLASYAGAAAAAWRTAWRHLRRGRDEAEAALLLEGAAPALRERLLAAVELARREGGGDSLEFRERLQQEVAEELGRLDLRRVLPWQSVRSWAVRLAGLTVLLAGLACIPPLHLTGFLARAAVPFANLARPSTIQIAVVRPQPASTLAAFASEVEIQADIAGGVPDAVLIEVQHAGGTVLQSAMRPAGTARYEGVVAVGQGDVRYRILAGDAISPWHLLSARARPRVVEFTKVLTPPAYSGLPERRLTESQGDLEALEGTVVRLSMKTNQPVAKADLLLNPDLADHPEALPLQRRADGLWTGEVVVKPEHESWRTALTASETGFTDEETSPWRIASIPDLPPTAQLAEPQEQQPRVADEAVRIQGSAADDVGLASVRLAHAVNGAGWQERELSARPGREAAVQSLLPLGSLQVKAGDAVLVKLVAVDLKGQRSESPTVRVSILEQTVDPRQRLWAEEARRLAQQAAGLAGQSRELHKAVERLPKTGRADPQAATTLARAQAELQQVSERATDLWEQLKVAAQAAPTHLDAMEVRLLGERLAHLRKASLAELQPLAAGGIEAPERLRRAAAEARADAESVAQAARAFAAEDNARLVTRTAQQLGRQAALLTDQSLAANRDSARRPKWQEQQRAALAASESLRAEMHALQPVFEGGQQRLVETLRQQLEETAGDLAASLDKPDQTKSPEHLYGAADNHRQRLVRASDTLQQLADATASRAAQLREQLARQDNPALTALNEARSASAQALAEAKAPKARPRADRDGRTALERTSNQLAQAAKQLEDQAALREQSGLTNTAAALDGNRVSRAADQLARQAAAAGDVGALEPLQQKTEQLHQAARLLETDALVQSAVAASAEAAETAPAEAEAGVASAQARAAAETLRQLPDRLKRLRTPDARLGTLVQQAAETSRQAADQWQSLERQAVRQPGQPVDGQAAEQAARAASDQAAEVARQISDQAAEARAGLAALTPQVSEMMRAVAQEMKAAQSATQAAAQAAENQQPVAEVAGTARQLQAEAQANAGQMESLQAALRQEANAADLQQAGQRQMARAADVALAQMQQKTPQIAQNLRQAAQAAQSQPQAQALQQAAAAQQQTAQGLEQLAENLAKMEQGQELSEQDLAAMQQLEKDLGVQEPLDEAYQRAQELAKMAQDATQNPAAVLAALEKELPQNPTMQKALAELSRQTAQSTEQAVAAEAQQPSNLGLAAEQAAHDLARIARHQQRLGRQEAAREASQASGQLQQQAQAAKGQPGQPQTPVGQGALAAAAQAAKAAEASAMATAPPMTANPFQQVQGALLAQALDQIDQTLNPKASSSSQPQQGGEQGQAGSQQKAQQNLAEAQQSQQQSMASQRNDGQTPGAQPSSRQQQAQNSQRPNQGDPSQTPNEGGNQSMQLVDGALGPASVLVEGDWGHLPSKMAADLSEASRAEAAPEYRAAIESYYKAIATKGRR